MIKPRIYNSSSHTSKLRTWTLCEILANNVVYNLIHLRYLSGSILTLFKTLRHY